MLLVEVRLPAGVHLKLDRDEQPFDAKREQHGRGHDQNKSHDEGHAAQPTGGQRGPGDAAKPERDDSFA